MGIKLKTFKNLLALSLLTWSTLGFCLNLSIFEGKYNYSGSNYDPRSSACPDTLIVKQVLTANNEIVNLQLIGVNTYGDKKPKLIQIIDREDINPEPSFFKNPKQSVVNFGGLGQGYEGSMLISDDGQPFHSKYVSIHIKKYIDFENYLNCRFTL